MNRFEKNREGTIFFLIHFCLTWFSFIFSFSKERERNGREWERKQWKKNSHFFALHIHYSTVHQPHSSIWGKNSHTFLWFTLSHTFRNSLSSFFSLISKRMKKKEEKEERKRRKPLSSRALLKRDFFTHNLHRIQTPNTIELKRRKEMMRRRGSRSLFLVFLSLHWRTRRKTRETRKKRKTRRSMKRRKRVPLPDFCSNLINRTILYSFLSSAIEKMEQERKERNVRKGKKRKGWKKEAGRDWNVAFFQWLKLVIQSVMIN